MLSNFGDFILLGNEYTRKLSIKQEKHSTRTLSLIIHSVRFKKTPAKKYISIQWGMKLRKPSIFVVN
jgi:hypothetical protein